MLLWSNNLSVTANCGIAEWQKKVMLVHKLFLSAHYILGHCRKSSNPAEHNQPWRNKYNTALVLRVCSAEQQQGTSWNPSVEESPGNIQDAEHLSPEPSMGTQRAPASGAPSCPWVAKHNGNTWCWYSLTCSAGTYWAPRVCRALTSQRDKTHQPEPWQWTREYALSEPALAFLALGNHQFLYGEGRE